MQRFAELLDNLVYTQSRNRKLALLADYFRNAPDPDRGWALAVLTDGLTLRMPLRRTLAELLEGVVDPHLYRLSRDYVGDTAETVSLLWPDREPRPPPPSLDAIVTAFSRTPPNALAPLLAATLDSLDVSGRFALLKLIGGAPRVGVSARLAKQALVVAFSTPSPDDPPSTGLPSVGQERVPSTGLPGAGQPKTFDIADVEELWHAVEPPYADLFAWLEGKGEKPDPGAKPVFRPLMLAHPIEQEDWPNIDAGNMVAEWKWDGIRVQVASKPGETRIYSRTGDDISRSFPEIASAFAGRDLVADGELLIVRDGLVAPFNDLQQRLGRKTVPAKMLRTLPAHVRLYDLLMLGGEDLRSLPFTQRRARLEAWFSADTPPLSDLSELVPFDDFAQLSAIWGATRAAEIEGLMLKRADSPYLAGRPKGHWWKWKRAPLTLDCVMMYAQRGSGKRSSLYSDYTFGVWDDTAGDAPEPPAADLVPVGKAYSGFTDEELAKLDRFIRQNTTQRFGPVRAVEPALVLEIAFDAVQRSPRHKSGIAMRFPRIARIRWDKPAEEADRLSTVMALLPRDRQRP